MVDRCKPTVRTRYLKQLEIMQDLPSAKLPNNPMNDWNVFSFDIIDHNLSHLRFPEPIPIP